MKDILREPIFIIGGPRSGTSVLGRLLACHETLAYANEPRTIWRYGNDGKSDMLVRSDARPEVVSEIRKFFHDLVKEQGAERLLEKTPSNSLRVDFVHAVFPDAKFVNIVRDGYESALSIRSYWQGHTHGVSFSKINIRDSVLTQRLKEIRPRQLPYYAKEFLFRLLPQGERPRVLWGPRLPGMDRMVRDMSLLAVSALQWRYCVECACMAGRRLPREQYLEIRLEDLNAENFERIRRFCQLPESTSMEEFFTEHFESGKARGRKEAASIEEIEEIRSWIEPTMRWLGYANVMETEPSA